MENTVGLRIETVRKYTGLNTSEFAEKIGVIRTQLYRYKKGEQSPSYDLINKILTLFPDISPQWLMLGQGEMLISQKDTHMGLVSEPAGGYSSATSEDDMVNMLKNIQSAISVYLKNAEKRKK